MAKSIADLRGIREQMQEHVDLRLQDNTQAVADVKAGARSVKNHILVCGGTGCVAAKSLEVIDEFNAQLKKHGLTDEVKVVLTGCFGLCALGPIVVVYPEGFFYSELKTENIPRIVEEHLLNGNVVKELLYHETVKEDGIGCFNETGFYKKQLRISLRNCGLINPECIDEYIAVDGYEALAK